MRNSACDFYDNFPNITSELKWLYIMHCGGLIQTASAGLSEQRPDANDDVPYSPCVASPARNTKKQRFIYLNRIILILLLFWRSFCFIQARGPVFNLRQTFSNLLIYCCRWRHGEGTGRKCGYRLRWLTISRLRGLRNEWDLFLLQVISSDRSLSNKQ